MRGGPTVTSSKAAKIEEAIGGHATPRWPLDSPIGWREILASFDYGSSPPNPTKFATLSFIFHHMIHIGLGQHGHVIPLNFYYKFIIFIKIIN